MNAPDDDFDFIQPLFLGPAAENDQLLESLVVEFLRDHAYWRRNFHPEDGFRIEADARHRPDFLAMQARIRSELYKLSADLKRAVPFFHPRYVGHMTGDLLLPGLVAKLVTTLYNPNNVSEEAAPVTVGMELEAGEQLARMFGFSCDESKEPCAWGHLTGGGTVANYEALWNFRSLRCYGLALQAGAAAEGWDPEGVGPASKALSAYTTWELLNLSIDETVALRREVAGRLRELGDRARFHAFSKAVRRERVEHLGTAGFFLKHGIEPPRVLVSASAHYSWAKGMKVLGLGTAQLLEVPVDARMRMDADALDAELERAERERAPVLCVVGMLGTTEFGTVDPIDRIVEARDRWKERGLDFGVHVDAAWGGYLASVFRRPDGSLHTREEVAQGFRHFPSAPVYGAFAALGHADSITVDPHKLGYVPYPAGAFIARNREVVDFLYQEAAYVFDLGDREEPMPTREKLHNLGQYILEGSKPGNAAAAVALTHRVLPLDSTGLGRILRMTVRACEEFYDSVAEVRARWAGRVRVCTPFEPDSNLICLAINPEGNTSLARMNAFGREVFQRMKVEPGQSLQGHDFIGSYTSLRHDRLDGHAERILAELGIDPATLNDIPTDPDSADHIFILRHTLMNPWHLSGPDGVSYVERYWSWLERTAMEVLGS